MLGFFTDPHRDELLYSACARYDGLMRFSNSATATRRFFGNRHAVAIVDLPTRIDHLINVLPLGHSYTPDILISKHTLEPFYSPFLPPERVRALRSDMRGASGNHAYERLGIKAREFKQPAVLRFCPACVSEDRKEPGETYWHRIHQITGVEVCPKHEVFLEASSAPWRHPNNHGKVVTAESVVSITQSKPLDLADPYHVLLLKIAREAVWLLDWQGTLLEDNVLLDRYHNLLLRRGYAYYNGRVKQAKFLKSFLDFYPPNFLKRLHCSVGDQRVNWPLRLISRSGAWAVKPPLHHILLMIFLGCTAEEVFTRFEEFKPFGTGPWPCLNPVASHYKQMVITECQVTNCVIKKKFGRPRGDFPCSCDFIYTRTGPDLSSDDQFHFDSVVAYGQVWENTFREQWQDSSLTLKEMAKNFGVIQFTLTRHAIRLGLPFPRQSRGSRMTSKHVIERRSKTRETFENSRRKYRQQWLLTREANPSAGRRQLQSNCYYAYWWLRRNDPEWLESQMPPSQTPLPPPLRVDWESADKELAAALVNSSQRIKNLPGPPVRASIAEITREVGRRAWIEQRLSVLPLTSQAITEHVESLEDFMIRKVKWAANNFLKEKLIPTRAQLEKRAGVINKTAKRGSVQKAIDAAMEMFGKL